MAERRVLDVPCGGPVSRDGPFVWPLYGLAPDLTQDFGLRLGTLAPRGERGVLVVGMDDLMRLSSNPFFAYVEQRLMEWVR